jgi:methyl-accepting chemotaxis protein
VVADEGAAAVADVSAAMGAVRESAAEVAGAIAGLSAQSGRIGEMTAVISRIAEQTSLLALNAAIEAARAGEQGRGFAVVAEEVRKLADESSGAATGIAALIDDIQAATARTVLVVQDGAERTSAGEESVERVRGAFGAIGSSVEDMGARVERIAATVAGIVERAHEVETEMAQVAAVAEQASASTEQVSASAQQTSASAQQIAGSARDLSDTAGELRALVAAFRI